MNASLKKDCSNRSLIMDVPSDSGRVQTSTKSKPPESQARATGLRQGEHFRTQSGAVGVLAIGALAAGAFSIGALAIGFLAVRRLIVGKARVRSLKIEELDVKRLRVSELIVTDTLITPGNAQSIIGPYAPENLSVLTGS